MTIESNPLRYANQPDAEGRFGEYGGRFVAETLMSALADLEAVYRRLKDDPEFQREFDEDLAHYVGRPSPLYEARLSTQFTAAELQTLRACLLRLMQA